MPSSPSGHPKKRASGRRCGSSDGSGPCFRRRGASRPGLHQPWFSISRAKSISAFITRVINFVQTELVYSARSDGQRRGSGGCRVQNPARPFAVFLLDRVCHGGRDRGGCPAQLS